jgi:hypothetical protein
LADDSTEVAQRRPPTWRTSSFSGGIECVSVATIGRGIALRNSNHPDAGTLFLDHDGAAAWIAGCKAGEFDDLTT